MTARAADAILIMGGQKAVSIKQFPILSWYHNPQHASGPGSRLMVIGYSFSDTHINSAIIDAIRQSDLKAFLVDPSGDNILGPLYEVIAPRLIGISQRPISSTFNDDTVEHSKLMRFFE